ncbi:MAG: tetratricopeptide repeat protein, partial [Bacteroidota bacterium]
VDRYKENDFANAISYFQTSIEINQNLFGRTDTVALYNRALAANKSGNTDMALKDFEYLTTVNYGGSKIYSLLGNMYLDRKDTTNALLRINQGRKKYPDDNTLITQALNIYLTSGRDQEALRENDEAIKADPGNHILYYIKGNLQDKIGNRTEAVLAYKKCLELKPDYFDANYNLGAMYFNEGADLSNKANAIPTSKMAEYDAMKKKFEAKFKEALPYLEKAHAINPTDMGTMQSLRQLYTRMGNLEKASEIKKKMEGQ